MSDWELLHKLIGEADRVLLTTHENPDGDGLGCASAMWHYLQDLKIETRFLCVTGIPDEYNFLMNAASAEIYNSQFHDDWLATVDLALVFDIGDYKRLRGIGDQITTKRITVVNIDHHVQVDNGHFTHNLIDLNASAVGEMLFDFFKQYYTDSLPITVAEGLYTAILTDTGSFRYSNTSARCHEVVSECIQAGIQPSEIYQNIYESNSIQRAKLLGMILSNIQFESGGELAWFQIDQQMLSQCSATNSDVDGFTDFVRSIRGVEVALMLYQNGSDTCRINFRSKGKYNIHPVALEMGGGGHPFAAGAIMNGTLDTVIPKVLKATMAILQAQKDKLTK